MTSKSGGEAEVRSKCMELKLSKPHGLDGGSTEAPDCIIIAERLFPNA